MAGQQLAEDRIFNVARRLTDPEARHEYLEQVCGDLALRGRLQSLLEAHSEEGFMESPPVEAALTVDEPVTERPGSVVGPYKLREQIGEGGMGVVFVAEQERPIRRKVALKVIKPGMDSKAVVARFEAERQALAMMDHPNIAKVLDAGTTDSGRPYFAMELVKGIPITGYCDKNKLTIRERLNLFVQVCQAIQHAHQKGIIHRDIKPSNVLVTMHDGKPVPKVIDFGVAKALNTRLTDKTIYTEHLQIVGTLLYMSPEQAELSGLDVDTRSDVYSLGVLLYELLTGTTPFQQTELDAAGFDEQRRMIRETDPPRASQRISSLGETATAVAEHRKTDAKKLQQSVRGDLDCIVMKSLEKDRIRRYATATGLASDIQRVLRSEPIEARPPSASYRFRVFVCRNKGMVTAAAVVLLLLLLGVVGTTSGWRQAIKRSEELRKRTDALENKNSELDRVVKDYLDELIQRALAAAMSGDRNATLTAIQQAKEAGMSDATSDMLRGQLELYSGNLDEAIVLLKRSRQSDANVTVLAMLAVAYGLADDPVERNNVLQELESKRPESARDYLFLGESRLYFDTATGIDLITKSMQMEDSPLNHAVLADAYVHQALEIGNQALIAQALRHADAAALLMPRNTYALNVHLFAHAAAIRLTDDQDRINELRMSGDRVAAQLADVSSTAMSHSMRAHYFDSIGAAATAFAESQKAVDAGGTGYFRLQCASLAYRLDDADTALHILDEEEAIRNPVVSIARAELLALEPSRREEAIRFAQEHLRRNRDALRDFRKGAWQLPESIGLILNGSTSAVAPSKRSGGRSNSIDSAVLAYIDERNEDKLLEEARSSTRPAEALCIAHKMIGVTALVEGDKDKAKSHFADCLKTGYFIPDLYWAAAYLGRLNREPEWSRKLADAAKE